MSQNDRLVQITDTLLQVELAAFRDKSHAAAEVQQELDALNSAVANLATPLTASDAATQHRFLQWAASRRREIQLKIARALADREQQRKRAERAFGKAEVAKSMQQKATANSAIASKRKEFSNLS